MMCCWIYDVSFDGAGRYLLYLEGALRERRTLQSRLIKKAKLICAKHSGKRSSMFFFNKPPHWGRCFEWVRDKTNSSVVRRTCQRTWRTKKMLFPECWGSPVDTAKEQATATLTISNSVWFAFGHFWICNQTWQPYSDWALGSYECIFHCFPLL